MSPAHRLAALRLRTLHADDRAWLLERLPAEQREALVRALAALEPMLAAAPALDPMLAFQQARNAHDTLALLEPPQDWLEALDAMTPSWAALALHGVADDLRVAYLKHCDADRRRALTRADAALPARLPVALQRFVRAAAQPDAGIPTSFLDALRQAPAAAPTLLQSSA